MCIGPCKPLKISEDNHNSSRQALKSQGPKLSSFQSNDPTSCLIQGMKTFHFDRSVDASKCS